MSMVPGLPFTLSASELCFFWYVGLVHSDKMLKRQCCLSCPVVGDREAILSRIYTAIASLRGVAIIDELMKNFDKKIPVYYGPFFDIPAFKLSDSLRVYNAPSLGLFWLRWTIFVLSISLLLFGCHFLILWCFLGRLLWTALLAAFRFATLTFSSTLASACKCPEVESEFIFCKLFDLHCLLDPWHYSLQLSCNLHRIFRQRSGKTRGQLHKNPCLLRQHMHISGTLNLGWNANSVLFAMLRTHACQLDFSAERAIEQWHQLFIHYTIHWRCI